MSRAHAISDSSRPTRTVENYLMNMHVLERDQGEIVAARLAEILQVAPATVAMTFKRMERDGWITGKAHGKGVHLTETGQQAASSVVRRHMLTEWLLMKILKMPAMQIHAEAHNMEHAISPQLEQRLVELLENPQVCPHGNPFPGCEAVTQGWVALTEVPAGTNMAFRRIHELAEENESLLAFLYQNGIKPGANAQLVENLPFNQTLTVSVEGHTCILGFPAARQIFVEIQPA